MMSLLELMTAYIIGQWLGVVLILAFLIGWIIYERRNRNART